MLAPNSYLGFFIYLNTKSHRKMDLTEVSKAQACVTVAVMGPTGSGKSTFIKAMTGREDIAVGNNLKPG